MATRTGKDLEDLRGLLAEVQALRDHVETESAELRREWGAIAEKAEFRADNLSRYIALRSHDLNDLQLKLSARGLSSLGRSEAKVAATLDALIVTLRRLTGETNVPYPSPALARGSASELEAEADRLFGKRPRGAPRVRVMATLPAGSREPARTRRQPDLRRDGLRAHQLRPRRSRGVGTHDRARAQPPPGTSAHARS